MKRPNRSYKWTTFVEVFSNRVWLFIFITYVVWSLALMVTKRLLEKSTDWYISPLASVGLALISLDVRQNPVKLSSRIMIFSVCMAGALKLWSYNAGLVSLLTVVSYF